jgi:multidrug efflux system outer membrane protein
VRLARSSLANAEASQSLQMQRFSSSTRRLEILLRRYPSAELNASSDLPLLPELSGAGTPDYVMKNRPDLLAAEYRLKSQGFQIEIAKKNLLPRFTLDGSGSLASRNMSDFFEIDALVASLAGGISAPVFQGGRLKANLEQQKVLMKSQLESYAGLILNAYLEVENAIGSEKRLREQEKALRISLNEAQKAESRLELRYTEGLATILQLLDAQSRSLTAEGQLISSRKERLSNRVRLHVALGGGVELLKLSHSRDAQAFELEKKE